MTINRREFLRWTALAGLASCSVGNLWAANTSEASDLYKKAIVVDGCGSPAGFSTDPQAPLTPSMIEEIRSSGVTCVNLTVGPVGNRPALEAFEGIFQDLAYWENELDRHPDVLLKVKRFDDIALAKSSGRLGIIFGLQDGVAFENDLSHLEVLSRFSVRIIQPTYNIRNLLGDGCMEKDNAGLSKTGLEAVKRMNELGILVDLSHCGQKTTMDAITASGRPVAFTHTGCAVVYDHPRNKTDEELRLLADHGGVAGIYFMPYLRGGVQPMAEDLIHHIDHAVQIAGEDHVGLGTDGGIPGIQLTPEFKKAFEQDVEARKKAGIGAPGEKLDVYTFLPDLNTSRRMETLAGMLLSRGYSTGRVEKILGANFARLFHDAWP